MNDQFRASRFANETNELLPDTLSCPQPTPDKAAEVNDELASALNLLDSLPTQQRLVLFLVTLEDLSLADVCEVLEITMTNAKANLSLARKRLRDELLRRTTSKSTMTTTSGTLNLP